MTTASTTILCANAGPRAGTDGRATCIAIGTLWVIAIGCVLMLVIADLFPQRLEKTSQPYLALAAGTFVVQTLQFHIAIVSVLCVVAACAARRWRLAAMAGMGVALGFGPGVLGVFASVPPPQSHTSMRLMSMNVFVYNDNAAAILDRVRGASADVVVLQEYTTALDEPIRAGLVDYPYQLRKPRDDSDGWAVYSRRPLVAPIDTSLRLHESKRQARFGVRLGERDVVIYALHLTSPKSMEQIGRNRAEVADLCALLAGESRPVVLAGDFNFTNRTANAAALRARGLRSTHDLAGNGRGSTWRYAKLWDRLPGFRIDHVFISEHLTCTNSQVLDPAGSDHRPIIADIALAEEAETK
ncbi:MAG: endonuclease/exonuclease/phosphatase family protein [Tepidisphaeraceae bacterium]